MTAIEAMSHTGMANMQLLEVPLAGMLKLSDSVTAQHTMPKHKGIILHDSEHDSYHEVGVVGIGRTTTQFIDLAEPLDLLVDQSGGMIETFGLFDSGGEWFGLVKMPESVTIGGDEHHLYAFGHDGLWSNYIIAATAVRVCCKNTCDDALMALSKEARPYRFVMRHTSRAKISITEIRAALELTYAYVDDLDRLAKIMLDQEFVESEFLALTAHLFDAPDLATAGPTVRRNTRVRHDTLTSMFTLQTPEAEETLASTYRNGHPTKWTAFQAISEYIDWISPVKGNSAARRLERTMDRTVQKTKTEALKELM